MKRRSIIFGLIIFILSLSLTNVYANSIGDLKKEQKDIDDEIKDAKEEVKKIEVKSKDVNKEIKDLDKRMEKASGDLGKIEEELAVIQKDIEKNTKELEEAEESLEEKEKTFGQRIRAMYMNGDIGYLEIVLSSSDIKDFFSKRKVVQSIAEYDKDLIKFVKEQRDIIDEKRTELKAQRSSVEASKAKIESRRAELKEASRKKSDFMGRLEQDVDSYKRSQDRLEEESKKIAAKLKKLQTPSPSSSTGNNQSGGGVSSGGGSSGGGSTGGGSSGGGSTGGTPSGGKFGWPVPGYGNISSYFGYRTHPIYGNSRFHNGIDIPAPAGTPIVAAESGKVIYAGPQGALGNVVTIDHGGGIATVYAHNSSVTVSNGQTVNRGDTIARAGSTGDSTGPHCHFEVRKNGDPVNPMSWLK